VTVRYRVGDSALSVEIHTPRDLPGEFVWQGRSYPLKGTRTRLSVPFVARVTN
jgi:hypothetical protein